MSSCFFVLLSAHLDLNAFSVLVDTPSKLLMKTESPEATFKFFDVFMRTPNSQFKLLYHSSSSWLGETLKKTSEDTSSKSNGLTAEFVNLFNK